MGHDGLFNETSMSFLQKFKLYFKAGGAIDFGTAMLQAAEIGEISSKPKILYLYFATYFLQCY